MPLASINLFALKDGRKLSSLIKYIRSSSADVLVVSKPVRWIIIPEKIDTNELLSPNWDLLLILLDNKNGSDLVQHILQAKHEFDVISHFNLKSGVPSRLTKDFTTKINPGLLHPSSPPLKSTGALSNPIIQSSSQSLALTPDLLSFIKNNAKSSFGSGAISMLNLLAFNTGMKDSYLVYGQKFAESVGKNRGGNAKLVGNIVHDPTASSGEKWDEFALAHYPSLLHFADMLASEDYQGVNQKYRVPALKDTCILFTSEIQVEDLMAEEDGQGAAPRAKL